MPTIAKAELINVTKRFGSTAAVISVSLAVNSREFLTLLGPSGCGKTTLLRLIAGFVTPDEGRIMLAGADVSPMPPYRRDVATVFQQYALFPHLNVFRNVGFGLERRGLAKPEISRRVAESLELVRLAGFDSRLPSELSGGQQQRVALARAIVLRPAVLLLDEPLAALDLKLRKQMQLELKGLQRQLGISFVYVTHDQEEALTMSDRIAVMNTGKVEQIGNAEDIYERPASEFVAGFIGDSNILNAVITGSDSGAASFRIGDALVHPPLLERFDSVKPGAQVRLMIRPEKILMTPGRTPGSLPATILSGLYLGESTRWRLRLSDGQELDAKEQNREGSRPLQSRIGEDVSISWDPNSVVVL